MPGVPGVLLFLGVQLTWSLAGGLAVLLNPLLDVGQFVLQVLAPLPFLHVCWILHTAKINGFLCSLLEPVGTRSETQVFLSDKDH